MNPIKAFAAVAALSFAGVAQAVPISFEFTGTVQVVSTGHEDWAGQVATGRFLIETDNFTVLPTPPPQITWTDVLPFDARPAPITASISIGGETFSLNSEVETYGGIHFVGSCEPGCSQAWRENWGISGNTQSFPLGGQRPADGYRVSSLAFTSLGPAETDFIPDSGLTPLDVLTLPLGGLLGNYNLWDYSCVEGECLQTGYSNAQFRVDTVTRTLLEPTPVPEPGTLGLFGAALLGFAAFRRRNRTI